MNVSRPLSNNPLATYPGSEYDADELEFLLAVRAWQKRTGRKFPTFVDVLHIARELGYRKPEVPRP